MEYLENSSVCLNDDRFPCEVRERQLCSAIVLGCRYRGCDHIFVAPAAQECIKKYPYMADKERFAFLRKEF
jgi:hypothetical protein